MSELKKFFVLSLILHFIAIAIVLINIKDQKPTAKPPFYAQIVTPHEIRPPAEPPKQSPRPKSQAPSRQLQKGTTAVPEPKQNAKKTPPLSTNRGDIPASKESQAPKPSSPAPVSNEDSPSQNAFSQFKGIKPGEIPSASSPQASQSLRDKLFDREVVGKLARANPQPQQDDGVTFDTKEFKYLSYMQRLKEKIESVWRYPPLAAQRGISGDLRIRFVIKKNGQLADVQILRTSGHKMLDDAALKAIKDAEPYWPLPNEWNQDTLTITGHFIYSLSGYYIR